VKFYVLFVLSRFYFVNKHVAFLLNFVLVTAGMMWFFLPIQILIFVGFYISLIYQGSSSVDTWQ